MRRTIAASWKQGSDPNGRNYFYNYVTGESQWEPPENWQSKVRLAVSYLLSSSSIQPNRSFICLMGVNASAKLTSINYDFLASHFTPLSHPQCPKQTKNGCSMFCSMCDNAGPGFVGAQCGRQAASLLLQYEDRRVTMAAPMYYLFKTRGPMVC